MRLCAGEGRSAGESWQAEWSDFQPHLTAVLSQVFLFEIAFGAAGFAHTMSVRTDDASPARFTAHFAGDGFLEDRPYENGAADRAIAGFVMGQVEM